MAANTQQRNGRTLQKLRIAKPNTSGGGQPSGYGTGSASRRIAPETALYLQAQARELDREVGMLKFGGVTDKELQTRLQQVSQEQLTGADIDRRLEEERLRLETLVHPMGITNVSSNTAGDRGPNKWSSGKITRHVQLLAERLCSQRAAIMKGHAHAVQPFGKLHVM